MTNIRIELISSLLNLVDFEAVLSVDKDQIKLTFYTMEIWANLNYEVGQDDQYKNKIDRLPAQSCWLWDSPVRG